jgi:hypothetical protein
MRHTRTGTYSAPVARPPLDPGKATSAATTRRPSKMRWDPFPASSTLDTASPASAFRKCVILAVALFFAPGTATFQTVGPGPVFRDRAKLSPISVERNFRARNPGKLLPRLWFSELRIRLRPLSSAGPDGP